MPAKKLNDTWFRFLGIPTIALMGSIIFYNRNEGDNERFGFFVTYLLSVAETMLLWETNRLVFIYIRNRFPSIEQTRKRILYTLFVATLLTLVVRTLNIWFYDEIQLWGYRFPLEAYLQAIFVALLFVIIVGGIYEGIYYFNMWKNTAVEAESLKRENLQTQLDSLKTQINPHFLFNSLGSLSSLIELDPKRAQLFVGEMSSVYRYLLQSNEVTLTTLERELDFIEAYYHLLKTRFEEGLRLEINVGDSFYSYFIPPLTLQLLVENAVKHNVVLASRPLLIKIYVNERQQLVVENNYQPKNAMVQSSKMGLKNIESKFRLLKQGTLAIEQTTEFFKVFIPLIKNANYESIDSRG